MKVLLVKCHKKTIFSMLEPIVTEPLELEYLSGLLKKLEVEHRIYDPLIEGGCFEKVFNTYKPDVLVLSGYITAVNTIIRHSRYAKNKYPDVKVVVGGVHAEINYEDFFLDTIDFIVHADGVNTFAKLLQSSFSKEEAAKITGIAFHDRVKWQINSKCETSLENLPLPNRSYFEKYKAKTKYLHYHPVALVRTALSCPFNCSFCYCKLLNKGTYSARSIQSVAEEITSINSEYIWIVDDSFLLDRGRVLEFIAEIKRQKIKKKFIAYSRVDFILGNEDIIEKLADIGFVELIIGMEAVDDKKLKEFNKHYLANDNLKSADILAKYGIRLTALFIVGIDFTFKDFRNLSRSLKQMKLDSYTFSIFTPLKGTEVYQNYQDQIIRKDYADYAKYDFLHLVLRPSQMSPAFFYLNFYLLYLEQFFRSRYIRRFIWDRLKRILGSGGSR